MQDIVVATDEHHPIIGQIHPFCISLHNVVIVALPLKPEATISGNNDNRVRHLVLNPPKDGGESKNI